MSIKSFYNESTVAVDDKEVDYIVYHANVVSGSGWNGRCVFAQEFTWDENDKPVFGKPIKSLFNKYLRRKDGTEC